MSKISKHAIIACHPAEDSFTMSVAGRYAERVQSHGDQTVLRDLYRIEFDPVLKEAEFRGQPASDILEEWGRLDEVDVFVLVYPIWFGAPPAMIKGYIDRVFGAGRKLGFVQPGVLSSRLEGKNLVSLTLSGNMRAWLDEKGVLGSLRNLYDRYLCEVFSMPEAFVFHFDGIAEGMSERDYRLHLSEVDAAADKVISRTRQDWQMLPDQDRN